MNHSQVSLIRLKHLLAYLKGNLVMSDSPIPPVTVSGWKKALWPFQSRKVQTALATIILAFTGNRIGLNEEQIAGIIALGVSIVLGIAIEDHGWKSGNKQ